MPVASRMRTRRVPPDVVAAARGRLEALVAGRDAPPHPVPFGEAPAVAEPPVTELPVGDPPCAEPPVAEPPVAEPPSRQVAGVRGSGAGESWRRLLPAAVRSGRFAVARPAVAAFAV